MAERHEKKRRAGQQTARVKLLFGRDLSWTAGFPLALVQGPNGISSDKRLVSTTGESEEVGKRSSLGWVTLTPLYGRGRIQVHDIDRERIRRSEFAASKLRHHSVGQLHQVFANPDAWFARFYQLIGSCKAVLHEGGGVDTIVHSITETPGFELPKNATDRLEAIDQIALGVAIADWLSHKPIGRPLMAWLTHHRHRLDNFLADSIHQDSNTTSSLTSAQEEVLTIISLHESLDQANELERIIACLKSRPIQELPRTDLNQLLQFESNHLKRLVANRPSNQERSDEIAATLLEPLRPDIRQLMMSACEVSKDTRKVRLKLFSQLGQPSLLSALEKTLNEFQCEIRRLKKMRKQMESQNRHGLSPSKSDQKVLLKEISPQLIPEAQVEELASIRKILKQLVEHSYPDELIAAISSWHEATVSEPGVGWRILSDLWEMAGRSEKPEWLTEAFADLFCRLARLVRSLADDQRWIKIFKPLMTRDHLWNNFHLFDFWIYRRWAKVSNLLNHSARLAQLDGLISCLIGIFRQPDPPENLVAINSIASAWLVMNDIDHVDEFIREIGRQNLSSPVALPDLQILWSFVKEPRATAELAKVVVDAAFVSQNLHRVAPLASHSLAGPVVVQWLQRRAEDRMRDFAIMAHCIYSAGLRLGEPESIGGSTDWVNNYPQVLQPILHDLAKLRPDAKDIAREILRHDFIDSHKRTDELRYLHQTLKGEGLSSDRRKELKNRVQRIYKLLGQQRLPTPARMKRLQSRLKQRWFLEAERWLESEIYRKLPSAMKTFGCLLTPERLSDPVIQRTVSGLLQLDSIERTRGFQLLQLSEEGREYPEMEHPANVAFVERLKESGIQMDPWMDFSRTWTISPASGNEMAIKFSADPLDYLLMGFHFQTCLSPLSMNFFNTIAAAIDVNKRVLYVRTTEGHLVGRCLVALGDNGELVRYRVYAHSFMKCIEDGIEHVLNEIAAEMGTVRSSKTTVSLLAAKKWYDDGLVGGEEQSNKTPQSRLCREIDRWWGDATPQASDWERMQDCLRTCYEADGTTSLIHALLHRQHLLAGLPPDWILELAFPLIDIDTGALVSELCLLAGAAWKAGRAQWMKRALERISDAQVIRWFQQNTCDEPGCYIFHFGPGNDFIREWLKLIPPHTALKALRASRRKGIRTDLDEVDLDRRKLLAETHQRLGRIRLPDELRKPHIGRR